MKKETKEKYENLKENLSRLPSIAVAFSGGVDSTLLLKVAHDVLKDKVIAITSDSCFIPREEMKECIDFCRKEGIKHIVASADPLSSETVACNPKDRCYHCKKMIFRMMIDIAKNEGVDWIAEGSNMDDTADYRPGMKAVMELKVISPLMEANLSKAEIREISKELNLATYDKPSFACLASRIPYGEKLTEENLLRIEKSEAFLKTLGFTQFRVRSHGDLARIEVIPSEMDMMWEKRACIGKELKSYGFLYVSIDMEGYRVGSLNAMI